MLFFFFCFYKSGHISITKTDGRFYDCEEADCGIFLLIDQLGSRFVRLLAVLTFLAAINTRPPPS